MHPLGVGPHIKSVVYFRSTLKNTVVAIKKCYMHFVYIRVNNQ